MNNPTTKPTRFIITIRWMARIIGTLSVAVFLIFFVADCIRKGTIAVESDRIVMTVFTFLIFIGLLTEVALVERKFWKDQINLLTAIT
jgi:hypothetical protein